MIVRIIGSGQFVVPDGLKDELNSIDNQIVACIRAGDKDGYYKELSRLIATVRSKGSAMEPREIRSSDLIIPRDDLSMEEAKAIFGKEGLLEG
jgi:hypothetical protein